MIQFMVHALLMMMTVMMILMMLTMVTALSRGLIQLTLGGLLTLMKNDDGRWN